METFATLNWSEDVGSDIENENEVDQAPSRSSSVMSSRDDGSISGHSVGMASGRNPGLRKKKRGRRNSRARPGDCSVSRDDLTCRASRERMNNQQNHTVNATIKIEGNNRDDRTNRKYDNNSSRRYRNGRVYRSRESSRDRDAHLPTEKFGRNSKEHPRRNVEENWRTGKRDKDDPLSNPPGNPQTAGVLVVPAQNQPALPRNITITRQGLSQQNQQQQQGKKTLFDPNNPRRPIIVKSLGHRASIHLR